MAITQARAFGPPKPPERSALRVVDGQLRKELDFIDRRYLLALARMSVGHQLATGELPQLKQWEAPSPEVAARRACFVTINSSGGLRGCIGSLQAHRPLMFDVIENAAMSAFHDERFPPLEMSELGHVRFSISVLGERSPLRAEAASELLDALEEGRHGLIVRKGACIATYLPYVWRLIPAKEDFLKNLCVKAGLDGDEWREPARMEFFTYEAQEFSE
ncbi:MAG TPA: AmmeMemoRadiSam system protein A [Candidatus Bilamarchaeum sp.]|nr:AmmeMemoRadiSam system protein A [Candidatus Bilamarchaeum sp.]